jgi:hypothetical protein
MYANGYHTVKRGEILNFILCCVKVMAIFIRKLVIKNNNFLIIGATQDRTGIVLLNILPIDQHTNLGDHAIASEEIRLLQKLGYDYIEITGAQLRNLPLRYPWGVYSSSVFGDSCLGKDPQPVDSKANCLPLGVDFEAY